MAAYSESFEQKLTDTTSKKIEKEDLLTNLQETTLPKCSEFFDLVRNALTDRRREPEFRVKCKELTNLTKVLLNLNIQPHLIDTGTIYIIYVFYELLYIDGEDTITEHCVGQLERVFDRPNLSKRIQKQAFDLCKALFSLINEEKLHYFFQENLIRRNQSPDEPSEAAGEANATDMIANLLNQNIKSIEPAPEANGQVGRTVEWLEGELRRVLQEKTELCFSLEELMNIIYDRFQDARCSDDVLQNDLLNLLGLDQIELIGEIIQNRRSILRSFRQRLGQTDSIVSAASTSNAVRPKIPGKRAVFFREPKAPSFTQTIFVQTEQELKEQRLLNKLERKTAYQVRKRQKAYNEYEEAAAAGEYVPPNYPDIANYQPVSNSEESEFNFYLKKLENERVPKEDMPYVFDLYSDIKQSSSFIANQKLLLPEGTEMNDLKAFKEITVPAPERPKKELLENFPLIPIEKLDKVAQKIFTGFKTLNQIQSVIYETATKTNENLLVSAPTGAGKTGIAMLTMINEIKKNTDEFGKINKDNFKIIYVTPMKALASEMTENFSKRLGKSVGLTVKELTGDMQLTWEEIKRTQVLVMTPEKLDVLSRKVKENSQLIDLIKLLIFDEVHLLQTTRGPVIETIVARIVRYVESAQKMIRLVGLSATLPNYLDVAEFLRVNPKSGLFFFDSRFRPVPLIQTFIGAKSMNKMQVQRDMDEICFEKVKSHVQKGNQCLVFVHTRHGTLKTANYLRDETIKAGLMNLFATQVDIYQKKIIESARNKQLQTLVMDGFAVHHAGLLRHDRNLVEKMFKEGVIKVLVCTATLAWGVNLPCHAVIIKGTEMYDPQKGGFVDLDFLDVIQIFGRAGRPQFDNLGHATIITTHDKLKHYLTLLTNQNQIESQFLSHLTDNLNAEIASGTVSTIEEAVDWMSYTYLFVRMQKNARHYGITASTLQKDPDLFHTRVEWIKISVKKLDHARMIRYDPVSDLLDPTDLGRVASHYYLKCDTIEKFNEFLNDTILEDNLLSTFCLATEFGDNLKSREEEFDELIDLKQSNCMFKVPLTPDHTEAKVNILVQSFLSRGRVNSFSLISDTFFIQQNVKRICRGLFDYAIRKGMPLLSRKLLTFSKMFELEQWDFESPLRQFGRAVDPEEIDKLERVKLPLFKLRSDEYNYKELARLLRCPDGHAIKIKKLANCLPQLSIETEFRPITRSVMQVILKIRAEFDWNDQFSGKVCESFWIWMEDDTSNHIYHYELFKITRKQVMKKELQTLSFTIPLLDPDNIPTHYIVHYDSDRWLACSQDVVINCENLKLPEKFLPFTRLLDLVPLPTSALNNELYESLYKYKHFNPIQTQTFHTLYHTDHNVLIGAPTGSGKTGCAEIACYRVFNTQRKGKIVYIGPLKALVRERVLDWKKKMENTLGRKVIELTGDNTPDIRAIKQSDIIVTTPEKYDGISRSWNTREYVQDVSLIIIDEIHLLNLDRGPVLEAIVSRTNFINRHTGKRIRIIGLSTAIANAQDIAHWLNIEKVGLYNFKPSVRPVPIECHIAGFPGRHYCPRMMSMNKSVFRAIQQHSYSKPVLVFVSSRRQTRLTALDLIALIAQENPKQWLRVPDDEINAIVNTMVKDSNLKLTLSFGIGIHHSGLHESDRSLCEDMFANNKIQILICTATLAWGINLPAHLVVIKGTEYYDGKTHKYVDFPITDVLQMIGRAGRIQFDKFGKAVVMVHDIKKEYYKKFLYEPFPVESSLPGVFAGHLNAEVCAGTIQTKDDCIQYLSWTFFFRRLLKNPSYYGLPEPDLAAVSSYLTQLVNVSIEDLIDCYCLAVEEDNRTLTSLPLGRITSFYYLHHRTVKMFAEKLTSNDQDFENLLWILTRALEFSELPVRHNEEILNQQLNESCRFKVKDDSFDSSHTKTYILLQAHFSRLELPCSDYLTDLKSVMDQCIRVLQAMIDIVAMKGLSFVCLRLVTILQMIIQGRWWDDESVLIVPGVEKEDLFAFYEKGLPTFLPQLISAVEMKDDLIDQPLKSLAKKSVADLKGIRQALGNYPQIELRANLLELEGNKPVNDKFELHFPGESEAHCVQLNCKTDYVLEIGLNKIRSRINVEQRQRAIAPKFNKPKDENWMLILEQRSTNELTAMKRCTNIQANRRSVERLVFTCPEQPGEYVFTLYFLSDCYLGLDQQFDFSFEAVAAASQDEV